MECGSENTPWRLTLYASWIGDEEAPLPVDRERGWVEEVLTASGQAPHVAETHFLGTGVIRGNMDARMDR